MEQVIEGLKRKKYLLDHLASKSAVQIEAMDNDVIAGVCDAMEAVAPIVNKSGYYAIGVVVALNEIADAIIVNKGFSREVDGIDVNLFAEFADFYKERCPVDPKQIVTTNAE